MTLKKKLLATAIGGALAAGLGFPAAQAHDILFPYVVKDANRTTLVTLIGGGAPVNAGPAIHLQYWTKSTTAANTAACEPSSTTLTFTDNDIVTFDTAGLLGAGPLFGDTTNNAPLGTSISYPGPRHGYLVAEWLPIANHAESGFWVEVDLANGGAHGDHALAPLPPGHTSLGDATGTSDNIALLPNETGANYNSRAVPFWPTSIASTVFTVTPLGSLMRDSDNTSVVIQVYNGNAVQGAYDRNENGVDGTVPQTVRCVGRLTAAQLMPGVVANAAWAATGGWGYLTNLGNGNALPSQTDPCSASGDCKAVIYQVDSSNAAGAGKFMTNAHRVSTDNN